MPVTRNHVHDAVQVISGLPFLRGAGSRQEIGNHTNSENENLNCRLTNALTSTVVAVR